MKDISVRVVCMMAQCRRVIVDGPPHPVSHGICEPCAAEWRRQAKAMLAGVVKAPDLAVSR